MQRGNSPGSRPPRGGPPPPPPPGDEETMFWLIVLLACYCPPLGIWFYQKKQCDNHVYISIPLMICGCGWCYALWRILVKKV